MGSFPEDIMNAAAEAAQMCIVATLGRRPGEDMQDTIAAAILAERKRCAKIASNEAERLSDNEENYPFTRVHDMMIVSRRIQFAISGEPNIHLKDAVRARITKTSEDAA